MNILENFDCIVTIVNKGHSEPVVEASRKAGAEGGTIIFGRGVLQAIVDAGNLEKPGTGIAFILPVKGVAGICHLNCPPLS